MKVSNMTSLNGNKVANQFIITDDSHKDFIVKYFQSYETLIAKVYINKEASKLRSVYIDCNDWDYSRTTLKYLAMFLRHTIGKPINTKKDIQSLIKNGDVALTNLYKNEC